MRELTCQRTWQLLQLPQICVEVINSFKLSLRFRRGVHLAFGLLHTATVICVADISEESAASTHSLFIAPVIADRALTCSAPPVGPWDCLPMLTMHYLFLPTSAVKMGATGCSETSVHVEGTYRSLNAAVLAQLKNCRLELLHPTIPAYFLLKIYPTRCHFYFKVCHPRCVCNSLGGRRIVKTTQLIRILISCVVLTILLPPNEMPLLLSAVTYFEYSRSINAKRVVFGLCHYPSRERYDVKSVLEDKTEMGEY